MPIEFHCEHCTKLIRTGDEHAGKRGKCPYCGNSVYIPELQTEPLPLAPVDESDKRQQAELREETRRLTQQIREEKDVPAEALAAPTPRPEPLGDLRLTTANMDNLIVQYALCMSKGDLAGADELAAEIRTSPRAAEEVMQRLTLDEIPPPELAKIPRPVLIGFFRQLREKK